MNEDTNNTVQTPAEPPKPVDPLEQIKKSLTNEEKENFFKAFLADKPYTAKEKLFQGKMELTFSTLSVDQNNAILRQMEYDKESGMARNTDYYLIRVIQYRIASSLIAIDGKMFAKDITEATKPDNKEKGETFLIHRLELMKDWPVYKVSSVTDAFNRFEKRVRALTEESSRENF